MSELTLSEAIKHCLEVAEQNETKALSIEGTIIDRVAKDCRRCAADHRQLAEWLTELKYLKAMNERLLHENKLVFAQNEQLRKLIIEHISFQPTQIVVPLDQVEDQESFRRVSIMMELYRQLQDKSEKGGETNDT